MDTPESLYKEQLERCTELMLKQNDIINKQRCELAYHRQFDRSRKHLWHFFWWLLINNVWPFSIWYHRFER